MCCDNFKVCGSEKPKAYLSILFVVPIHMTVPYISFWMLLYGALLTVDSPSKASQMPSPSQRLKAFVEPSIRRERDGGISCLLAIRAFGLIHCCFVRVRFTLFDEAICVRPACSLFKQSMASNLDLFESGHINTSKQLAYNEALRVCPSSNHLILVR